ncbi:MAG: cytochrome c biogenesis protein CcsA [Fimbriimonadaceae bacterium]
MKWVLALATGAATAASFLAPPAAQFSDPELARIIFFHLPCAFAATVFFIMGAYLGIRALNDGLTADVKAVAANEMAMVLALLTMATGMLFSKVQWGAWWSWDPRQTSFLFVLLIYGAYFALRAAISDDDQRAKIAGAYSAFSVLPMLFLVFVFPRIPAVMQKSLHPSTTISQGEFSGIYWSVVLSVFVCLLVICLWLYRLAVRAGLMELRFKNEYNERNNGNSPTPRVVRPVSLSPEGGKED